MDNKALKNKVIITAAVTGAWPKKENNPNVCMLESRCCSSASSYER